MTDINNSESIEEQIKYKLQYIISILDDNNPSNIELKNQINKL
jgi:hypothetical protein